jgi:anti-sigma B factor antagonist
MSKIDFEHIKTDMVNDVAVVKVLSKELRFPPQCKELGDELTLVAGQDWAKKLLVNLGHTKYLCSTGFAILFNLVKQSRQQGGVIKFCDMDPEVRIGADIIGLDKVAQIHENESAALEAFELD